MSRVRDVLAAEIAAEVRRKGLVVWDDPERCYADVVTEVVSCKLARYEGSWFALRREIEPFLGGPSKPELVVYVPARPPVPDPLEELRQAAKPYKRDLRTLLQHALGGELTEARIHRIARQARSLTQVEAVLEAGSDLDARLATLFFTTDASAIAVAVLTGERDAVLDGAAEAWPLVGEALSAHLGLTAGGSGDELRRRLFRHIALTRLASAAGPLPPGLATAVESATAAQVRHCHEVLDRLHNPRNVAAYRRFARSFDQELAIESELGWSDALVEIDVSPGIEALALGEGMRRLEAGDFEGVSALSVTRLRSSLWARHLPGVETFEADHPYRRWQALDQVATLRRLVAEMVPPARGSNAILTWYAERGWQVDRAHRLAELARARLGYLGELDDHFSAARHSYERWLEGVATALTSAVATEGLDPGPGLLRQSDVYSEFVRDADEPVAYVLVDALRLELGQNLADRLGLPADRVRRRVAVAAAPTITPVGMTNLLPGAEEGLSFGTDSMGRFAVSIAGHPVKTVGNRVDILRRDAGEVLDLDFAELASRSDARLEEALAGVRLVLVRSRDIDAAGEAGHLGTAWRAVDGALDDLANQLVRLGRLGVRTAVVTADHGFIVLGQPLSSGRVLARPGGAGELHRRCWIGTGGLPPDGAVRIALSELGVGGGLDLVVPAGLAVFPGGGTRWFFHGGLAPQEVIVPVLVVDLEGPTSIDRPEVTIAVAGRGITTRVFAATLDFHANLFVTEVTVRVVARSKKGRTVVARPVAGDGLEPDTGVVTVSAERRAVLTFQVIADLEAGGQVELEVLDTATGAALGLTTVAVVVSVKVEEDW